MTIEEIKTYLELGIMIIIAIITVIMLFKLLFKKLDKNGDGKVEKEEITDADIKFIKEMLKESISTIATGMLTLNGLTGEKAYKMLLTEAKASKEIFNKLEKENQNNENEK